MPSYSFMLSKITLGRNWFNCILLSIIMACDTVPESRYEGWQQYGGNPENNHYSSLTQIDTSNVQALLPAWTFNTGDADSGTQMPVNPIIIKGIMYGVSPKLKLFAVDALSGEKKWMFDPVETKKDEITGRTLVPLNTCRGVSYFENEEKEGRIFYGVGTQLYAIDAQNGIPVNSFGNHGKIDLHNDLGFNVNGLSVSLTTPGMIFKDMIIVGSRVNEALPSAPGHIRAYDVNTGKLRWIFHTIPQQNEAGIETWPGAQITAYTGGANVWSSFSLDEKNGVLFAPTGSAAYDFYGGNRKGDNLYANCVLAIDANTGKRIWHYQTVHHDVWDRDLPTSPVQVTIRKDGARIDALAQVTKQGYVFLLDRKTGKPVYPVNELRVPSDGMLEGEHLSATQPFPTFIKPFIRQRFSANDIDSLLPKEERDSILQKLNTLHSDNIYYPPSEKSTLIFPGFDGGAEWGGVAYDPETQMLYVNANEMPWILTMIKRNSMAPKTETNLQAGIRLYNTNCLSCHGEDRNGSGNNPSILQAGEKLSVEDFKQLMEEGRRMMPAQTHLSKEDQQALASFILNVKEEQQKQFTGKNIEPAYMKDQPYTSTGYNKWLSSRGTAVINPPWGTLTAINLNTGEHSWQIPLGHREDLTAAGYKNTGTENYGGPVVTAGGLLFIASATDGFFRAFNKRTGQLLWQYKLPAPAFATPAVYHINGKQFVVIACGGGRLKTKSGDSYVAFALPQKV